MIQAAASTQLLLGREKQVWLKVLLKATEDGDSAEYWTSDLPHQSLAVLPLHNGSPQFKQLLRMKSTTLLQTQNFYYHDKSTTACCGG